MMKQINLESYATKLGVEKRIHEKRGNPVYPRDSQLTCKNKNRPNFELGFRYLEA